ncbi:hypothetical protein JR316_0011241 [Psilocybe cubensis]|uniref:Uncharacterized protein n=2 Tax=Psilocybe cubensis TaxID=181762 RepID=A0ACB8GJV4_PSICU|nr:hypothetical protein JR316_0011241 [Psilocybe cubensis]KAH9475682.1 hypothetical protein JR316_0011241 [Psilocybe cubensis]
MPTHITSDQYIGNPREVSPRGLIHPDIERHDHSADTDRYLLPTLFAGDKGVVITAKYPGPGIFHITEGYVAAGAYYPVETLGSVFHVEEGSVIRWNCEYPSGVKG